MLSIEIIGNLGNDAEVKNINGKDVVAFNVAHSEKYNGQETTTWVSCLWYGNGGNLVQYLKKGTKVFARGRLSVTTYQNRDNRWVAGVNMTVTEIQLCGGKTDNDSPF